MVMMNSFRFLTLALLPVFWSVEGFVLHQPSSSVTNRGTSSSTTELAFGLPSFGDNKKKDDEEKDPKLEKTSIGLKGLVQLITAGAGAPFLGDFEGVDKETGKFMFSLEANNLTDENGESKQTKMPYFESGWVDPADLERERKRKEGGGGGFKMPWQK